MAHRAFTLSRLAAALGCWSILAGVATAQQPPLWRFWDVNDGLMESYTRSVWADHQGNVWAAPGDVDMMSWLDGYRVHQLPNHRQTRRTYVTRSGRLWVLSEQGELLEFVNQKWSSRPILDSTIPAGLLRRGSILPADSGRLWLLLADRLAEYDAATGALRTLRAASETKLEEFTHMAGAPDGDLWITGRRGVGKLEGAGGGRPSTWRECGVDVLGLHQFENPSAGANGELFVTASTQDGSRRTLLHFDGRSWHKIHSSETRRLRGWRGAGSSIWRAEGAQFSRLVAGRWEAVERKEGLSGSVQDVLSQPDGVFWVATSQGLVRYAPPQWKTPEPVAGLASISTKRRAGRTSPNARLNARHSRIPR